MNLPCSHRGPSLDALTKALGVEDLRAKGSGIHGAKIDSLQTAWIIDVMRCCGNMDGVKQEKPQTALKNIEVLVGGKAIPPKK